MAQFKSARRYYLGQRQRTDSEMESVLRAVWQAKQEGEAGAALPADFPFLSPLSDAGYTTDTDLDGADAEELRDAAGLTLSQGASVLAAFAELS